MAKPTIKIKHIFGLEITGFIDWRDKDAVELLANTWDGLADMEFTADSIHLYFLNGTSADNFITHLENHGLEVQRSAAIIEEKASANEQAAILEMHERGNHWTDGPSPVEEINQEAGKTLDDELKELF